MNEKGQPAIRLACTFSGAPEWTRTTDARFRKPTLYPLSYGGAASNSA